MTKSRDILPPRRRWQPWELDALRRFYPDYRTDWIARALGRRLHTVYAMAAELEVHKSATYLASPDAHRLDGVKGINTRFAKGHVPANKGRRGAPAVGRMAETQFKAGHRPYTWQPVGTVTVSTEGYPMVKLADPNRWGFLAQLVWASTHDWPLPAGMVLTYRDRDRLNCDPANLMLLSRRDLMARNTVHNYPEPLKQLIRARATLVRKIHDHEQDRGRAKRALRADGATGKGGEPRGRDRAVEGDG